MPPTPIVTPWLLDLGVTYHLIGDASNIDKYIPYHVNDDVTLGNSDSLSILNHDYNKLYVYDYSFNLSNTFHTLPLLLVHYLYTNNFVSIEFNSIYFYVKKAHKVLA